MTDSLMICASMYTNAFFSLQNEVEDCVHFAGVENDAIIIVQVGRKKRIITDRKKKNGECNWEFSKCVPRVCVKFHW